MAVRTQHDEQGPHYHTRNLKWMLDETALQARKDVTMVSDPKAQALFETAAEVLKGLAKAFEDFERKREQAWKA